MQDIRKTITNTKEEIKICHLHRLYVGPILIFYIQPLTVFSSLCSCVQIQNGCHLQCTGALDILHSTSSSILSDLTILCTSGSNSKWLRIRTYDELMTYDCLWWVNDKVAVTKWWTQMVRTITVFIQCNVQQRFPNWGRSGHLGVVTKLTVRGFTIGWLLGPRLKPPNITNLLKYLHH